MATWKKLVVSGSDISQLNNDAGYISASQVPAALPAFATASVNGQLYIADTTVDTFSLVTGSEGAGLTIDVSGENIVFDLSAIPNASLANSSIYFTGSGVSVNQSYALGQTASIDVSVDDSTIGVNASNQLEVLDGGITFVKLADAAVTSSVEGINATAGDDTLPTTKAVYDFVSSTVGSANNLDITGSDNSTITIDLSNEALTYASADGSVIVSGTDNTLDLSVDTGSAHFTAGVREKISAADTSGPAGIDMSYDSSTGEISGSLLTSSLMIGVDSISLGATASAFSNLTISESVFSGSFSGSFEGDGSGLTGLVTSLAISASDDGTNALLDLSQGVALDIIGTTNEVDVTISSGQYVIGLPSDVVIGNDLTVTNNAVINGDLTVIGTASFQETTNTTVADRFILLASGSTSADAPGGLVVQQAGTQGVGEVFGFDPTTDRWGISGSYDASTANFSPDAFMSSVIEGINEDPNSGTFDTTKFDKKGNIFVQGDAGGSIWIYS